MPSPYSTTLEEANRLAVELNSGPRVRMGQLIMGGKAYVTGYWVRPHEWTEGGDPISWAIVERWKYVDNPDLGEFGGAAIFIKDARHWAAEVVKKED